MSRKFVVATSARPTPGDRNAVARNPGFNAGPTAPHVQTSRWTYTVPAGKKALLELALALIRRDTAAGAVGYVHNFMHYTPSGGSGRPIVFATIQTNAVGDRDRDAVGLSRTLYAGDTLEGMTADSSTGGTVLLTNTVGATEYDA